jgi:predicted phosphodiesterase
MPLKFENVDDMDSTCLIIAGDLGYPSSTIYYKYLTFVKDMFDHVIVVSGNHETYKQSFESNRHNLRNDDDVPRIKRDKIKTNTILDDTFTNTFKKMSCKNQSPKKSWCDYWCKKSAFDSGCIYLDCDTFDIILKDGSTIKIAGCTLWSHIPRSNYVDAVMQLNDFYNCDDLIKGGAKTYNEWHSLQSDWLIDQLTSINPPDIVVTHHLPTYSLIAEKFKNSSLNYCYASNTIDENTLTRARLICCGHSHAYKNFKLGDTEFILNPLGYASEAYTSTYKFDYNYVLTGTKRE